MSAMASQITSLTIVYSRRRSKKPKLRTTGFCEGISPVTGEFPTMFPFDDVIMEEVSVGRAKLCEVERKNNIDLFVIK